MLEAERQFRRILGDRDLAKFAAIERDFREPRARPIRGSAWRPHRFLLNRPGGAGL